LCRKKEGGGSAYKPAAGGEKGDKTHQVSKQVAKPQHKKKKGGFKEKATPSNEYREKRETPKQIKGGLHGQEGGGGWVRTTCGKRGKEKQGHWEAKKLRGPQWQKRP